MLVSSGVRFYAWLAQPLVATALSGILSSGSPAQRFRLVQRDGLRFRLSSFADDAAPGSQGKTQKLRKWSGALVDAECMTSALHNVSPIDQAPFADPLSQFWDAVESSQRADQEHRSGVGSQPPSPSPTTRSMRSDGEPEASEGELAFERAQVNRVQMHEQAVKACVPKRPTTHFGLAVSGGQLLKFDSAGDFKAKEALNDRTIEPGKTVKATVIGIAERENSVRVASIQVKHRFFTPRVRSQPSSGR
jgi:hypothetical protein